MKKFLPPKEKTPLASWRKRKNLTQKELAERAGLTRVAVARIENSVVIPRRSTMVKIAAALDVALSDLACGPSDHSSITKGKDALRSECSERAIETGNKERGLMISEASERMLKADDRQLREILGYIKTLLSS